MMTCCRTQKQACRRGHLKCINVKILNVKHLLIVTRHGHVECLKYMYTILRKWHEKTAFIAAKYSKLSCLQFCFENQCPGNSYISRLAVNNLACCVYAGLTYGWSDRLGEILIKRKKYENLITLFSVGYSNKNFWLYYYAAKCGNVNLFMHLDLNYIKTFDKYDLRILIQHSHSSCTCKIYHILQIQPICSNLKDAVRNNHLDCFKKYIFQLNRDIIEKICAIGNEEIIKLIPKTYFNTYFILQILDNEEDCFDICNYIIQNTTLTIHDYQTIIFVSCLHYQYKMMIKCIKHIKQIEPITMTLLVERNEKNILKKVNRLKK